MFSLESPHRGDSNEYTQYIIFSIKRNHSKFSKICSYGILKGLKNEFETAVVKLVISVRATDVLYIQVICMYMLQIVHNSKMLTTEARGSFSSYPVHLYCLPSSL